MPANQSKGAVLVIDDEEIMREILETLAATRASDAESGGASAGPHRSDLDVRFAAKDMHARDCSTGEQKALLISMLLAQGRKISPTPSVMMVPSALSTSKSVGTGALPVWNRIMMSRLPSGEGAGNPARAIPPAAHRNHRQQRSTVNPARCPTTRRTRLRTGKTDP